MRNNYAYIFVASIQTLRTGNALVPTVHSHNGSYLSLLYTFQSKHLIFKNDLLLIILTKFSTPSQITQQLVPVSSFTSRQINNLDTTKKFISHRKTRPDALRRTQLKTKNNPSMLELSSSRTEVNRKTFENSPKVVFGGYYQRAVTMSEER